jgi:hypothetical protein
MLGISFFRRDVSFQWPSRRRLLIEIAKLGATALWIALIIWFVRHHAPQQLNPAQEIGLRSQTEALLESWAANTVCQNPGFAPVAEHLRHEDGRVRLGQNTPVIIMSSLSGSQTADAIDQAVRRVGVSQVSLRAESRSQMYWAVFELLRRRYTPDEVKKLLGDKKTHSDLSSASTNRC